jgi:hypothetical protein
LPEEPKWFQLGEQATPETMRRLVKATSSTRLPVQVNRFPEQALWFCMNTLFIANGANREGKHANAPSLTRQCLEALSVIELGLTGTAPAVEVLHRWEKDEMTAGEVRKWLEANVWPTYGNGLWEEPWADFMGSLARAIQPYAHYSSRLAQWQSSVHFPRRNRDGGLTLVMKTGPAAYDEHKATRITLYHVLITFALARVWIATTKSPDKNS